jgi:fructose-1,6-bisphosphatase/inositol monophosphatase family enzyme
MRLPDIDQVAALIAETARELILPRFGRLEEGAVMEKAPGDLVTIADQESEIRLAERLPGLLPGSRVLGEEAYAKDSAVLDLLDGDDPVWIVDPVDGTANFVAGRPRFATIVALARKGETLMGWIHLPIENRTAWTIRGEGAWLDGQRLTLARPGPLSTLRGGFNLAKKPVGYAAGVLRLRDALASHVHVNCAGADYIDAVSGRIDILAYRKLFPWDHAAGTLLHAEAGGWAAVMDGTRYRPTLRQGPILVAPDEASWHAARAAMGEIATAA